MVINLGTDLEAALNEQAHRRGVAPEVLTLNALRDRFLPEVLPQPREWEQRLLGMAKDCDVSLSDSAVRREAIYAVSPIARCTMRSRWGGTVILKRLQPSDNVHNHRAIANSR